MNAEDKAKELGAIEPYDGRINWVWSNGFPTKEQAQKMLDWLNENGYEHRGMYVNKDGSYSIRWRK